MRDSALPKLDQDDARPLNQQIADVLRSAIESGRLLPGARVPGENTLMAALIFSGPSSLRSDLLRLPESSFLVIGTRLFTLSE